MSTSTRYKLLSLLKNSKGEWLSGEALSSELNVSRAAIWKNITSLKEEGYVIESVTRKGYCLMDAPDLLLKNEIQEKLTAKIFGAGEIVHFHETDSTNSRARELAERGSPEGTVVVAEKQTVGRGRKGRSWFSDDKGGIYMSIILRPLLSPGDTAGITLMTAVALAEALLSIAPIDVKIKWPNDILVNGKKLSGILTEMDAGMDSVNYIIVGVGINVNADIDNFPDEVREVATSISAETGMKLSRNDVICAFLERLEFYYESSRKEGFASVIEKWKSLSDIIGRPVRVDVVNGSFTGRVADIDPSGILVLEDKDGNTKRIISGDVTIMK